MQHGICILSIVPCRKDPDSTSEMVTQLLFGETYSVLENSGSWLRIKITHDGYECWINDRQHTSLSRTAYEKITGSRQLYSSEVIQLMQDKQQSIGFPVTIGCCLPLLNEGKLEIDGRTFEFEGNTAAGGQKKTSAQIVAHSFLFLHAPYLWGGRSPFGIDCSGFTQLVFRLCGYQLPRDAAQQVEKGEPLSFVEESGAGDLAFFDNSEGRITHVGILLNNEQIIHASGMVRIDKFDHYGIFSPDKKGYTHHLRVIKRIASS